MSYTIDFTDKPNNPGGITVADQTINDEKSLKFVGKNYTGYAKVIAENFLHLLENFASSEPPSNPVAGQLWYFTDKANDPSQPQLLIYDGAGTWQPAGNVKRKTSAPSNEESVTGDLWVDTTNQQLYLFSGSNWVLVGPQFSEGTLSGPKVETIIDTLGIDHIIISFYVADTQIVVISKDEFTPKSIISGFTKIRKGINLIDTNLEGVTTTDFRFIGTASNSAKLGGVESSNFLRSDINSTTNGSLSIRNNAGLIIGNDLSASLSNSLSGETILYNKSEGSRIFLRTNVDGSAKDSLTISGTNIGINKTNPVYELDVEGTVRTSNNLFVSGTSNALDITSGSFRTAGGASITKKLQVGDGITVVGTIDSNSIIPTTDNQYNLGNTNYKYKNLFVDNIASNSISSNTFTGQLIGSVQGSASQLASATKFRIQGDATSNEINFNGVQTNGEAFFNLTIASDFITSKTLINFGQADDLLIVQRPTEGLRKLSVQGLFERAGVLPIGSILPFAGTVIPNGFLLCDGSEVLVSEYTDLWKVIQYTYKPFITLVGNNTFGLPDLRGRFPLGADNMFQGVKVPLKTTGLNEYTIDSRAFRVSGSSSIQVGLGSGTENTELSIDQLPDHQHDMKARTASGGKGQQYYATRNSNDKGSDNNIVDHTTNGPTSPGDGQFLPNSGGVDAPVLGNPVPLMNPFMTINYIIYSGKFI